MRLRADRVLVQLLLFGVMVFTTAGCGRKKQFEVEITPKFTRATHPVDAADSAILSLENFEKINPEMTQNDVRGVFGTSTPVVKDFKPEEEYELAWEAEGKSIAVRFRGEKSISKSQTGLDATKQ